MSGGAALLLDLQDARGWTALHHAAEQVGRGRGTGGSGSLALGVIRVDSHAP